MQQPLAGGVVHGHDVYIPGIPCLFAYVKSHGKTTDEAHLSPMLDHPPQVARCAQNLVHLNLFQFSPLKQVRQASPWLCRSGDAGAIFSFRSGAGLRWLAAHLF
jgi:hypothetical protein